MPVDGDGLAGSFHEYDPPEWEGPTAFYGKDYHAMPEPHESEVWDSLYVWATPSYPAGEKTMFFSMRPDTLFLPPDDRDYILELLQVPEGVEGAPPIGTSWKVPLTWEGLVIEVPAYRTDDGLSGYRFSFTITKVIPEPSALLLFGGVALALTAGRQRRSGPPRGERSESRAGVPVVRPRHGRSRLPR
jgi:hypothetical protein